MVGGTGANGTNPIAPLRSRNTSFATVHSAQKEVSTYSVTLWIGSISTRKPTIHPLVPPGCYGLSYRSLWFAGSYLRVTLIWSMCSKHLA